MTMRSLFNHFNSKRALGSTILIDWFCFVGIVLLFIIWFFLFGAIGDQSVFTSVSHFASLEALYVTEQFVQSPLSQQRSADVLTIADLINAAASDEASRILLQKEMSQFFSSQSTERKNWHVTLTLMPDEKVLSEFETVSSFRITDSTTLPLSTARVLVPLSDPTQYAVLVAEISCDGGVCS